MRLFRNVEVKTDVIERGAQSTGQIEIEIQLVAARFPAMVKEPMIEEERIGPVASASPVPNVGQETEQGQPEGGMEKKDGIKTTAAHQAQQT
ncbi:MAG: hypothetical protein BWY77_01002 [bacterium ADurb.Bin431]|nr:MAG: hypothetical protein BWY77_01002 [bacterium ADurb.Bin431]